MESDTVHIGESLYDARALARQGACRQYGVITANMTGSIHRAGPHVQSAPSCNDWTFWHVKRNDKLMLLDLLRREYRAHMDAA
jgi:modification methylase